MKSVVLVLASISGAMASYPKIASYAPLSDVVPHNKIDLSGYGMILALKGKVLDSYTANSWGDGSQETIHGDITTAKEHIDIAHDLYAIGGGGSSPYAKFTGTANKAFLGSSKTSYTCVLEDFDGDGDASTGSKFQLGSPKSLYAADATTFQIYYSNAACGAIPVSTDIGATSGTAGGYTVPYAETACPVLHASGLKTVTCSCSNCYNSGSDTVVITYTAITRGGRTLKGFSTGGAAKMLNYNMKEFVDFKAMHGGDKNAETMNDEAVQMAFDALVNGAVARFSTCTGGTGTSATTGATKNACTALSGSFTQGNVMCKDKDTRVQILPAGADFDAKVNDCENNKNGKVSNFFKRDFKLNQEVIQKISVYSIAWMYAIYEFEDAIQDCTLGAINNNDAGVHAWDEGVAFYTGSIAGAKGFYGTGDQKSGIMGYLLATKRCENFGTCLDGNTGQATANKNLFKLFSAGQFCTHVGDCAGARSYLEQIVPQMRVPLIQGTMRYAYKLDKLTSVAPASSGYDKSAGEGYAFMIGVVHAVYACNQADGIHIYKALDLPGDTSTSPRLGGGATWGSVKKAFEDNYACMGITCADVGVLHDSGAFQYGDGPCIDATAAPSAGPVAPAPAPAVTASPTTSGEFMWGLPQWGFIALAAGAAVLLILIIMICCYRSKKNANLKKYNELQKQLQAPNLA